MKRKSAESRCGGHSCPGKGGVFLGRKNLIREKGGAKEIINLEGGSY